MNSIKQEYWAEKESKNERIRLFTESRLKEKFNERYLLFCAGKIVTTIDLIEAQKHLISHFKDVKNPKNWDIDDAIEEFKFQAKKALGSCSSSSSSDNCKSEDEEVSEESTIQ